MIEHPLLQRLIKLEEDILYQEFAAGGEDEFHYQAGNIPVLLSAPHGAVHTRRGELKEEDEYTAGLARLLAERTGAHAIYARRKSTTDPNFYDTAPYKGKLKEVVNDQAIWFVLDLHGIRSTAEFGVALGTIDWQSCPQHKDHLPRILSQYSFLENTDDMLSRIVINHRDYSGGIKNPTITRYCMREAQVPAAQIELNAHLRIPIRKADATQPERDFRGSPVHILQAIRALESLTMYLAQ